MKRRIITRDPIAKASENLAAIPEQTNAVY